MFCSILFLNATYALECTKAVKAAFLDTETIFYDICNDCRYK